MFYLFISRLWWPQQPIYITLEGFSFSLLVEGSHSEPLWV